MDGIAVSKNIKSIQINRNKPIKMKRNVQWWQHIATFMLTMLGIWGFYINATDKIEKNIEKRATMDENFQQRIKFLEEKDASHNLYLDKKFTEIRDDIKETNKKVDQIYTNTKQNK